MEEPSSLTGFSPHRFSFLLIKRTSHELQNILTKSKMIFQIFFSGKFDSLKHESKYVQLLKVINLSKYSQKY